MAKLTARFDIEDNISKKLKTIRGEIDAIESSRKKTEKPVILDAVDKATKKIDKVNKSTEKFTKPKSVVVDAIDNATKKIEKVNSASDKIVEARKITIEVADKVTKPINAINKDIENKIPEKRSMVISALDKTKSVFENIRRYMNRHLTTAQMLVIEAKDRAMPTLHKIANYAKRALSKGYNFSVRAIDIATTTVGRIASFARTAIPRYRDFTVRAWDRATRVIGSIRRALFSIPAILTVTLAVVGVGKLKDATVGAAMNFEGYSVSMEHWLDGNKKQAQELVTWMGQFADKTPFSSPELFPALARGVGLAGGDVDQAKKLLEISTNMAALTPGRTVEDAMEALGSAQMGEFQMLKGYNVQMSKDDYDAGGGWEGLIGEIDEKFAGGARKLSETSSGILATLAGYRSSILRSMGEGILEPMKPRLDAINHWLENNQDTWAHWKNTVKNAGEEASEWVFSKLENGFNHIKTNYLENDDFMKLDFEGKVKFIMDDLSEWWDKTGLPLLEDVGLKFGKAMYEGMIWGVTEGVKGVGGMWGKAIEDPSAKNIGGAGVATLVAASIASLIITPLITAFGTGKKILWDAPKKVIDFFRKGKTPKVPVAPTTATTPTGKQPKAPKAPKAPKVPVYTQPWTNSGEKPILNVPNQPAKAPKVPKIPKGLSQLGNFAKRIPVIGAAVGAISIATASKEDKAGAVGGVGGGVAGAMTGGAIGTAITPVIGTAIGGVIGGIAGSIGGTVVGDWFSDNWSAIKNGASSTGQWVSDKFEEASKWSSDKFKDGVDWSLDAWQGFTETLSDAGSWAGEKFDEGVKFTKDKWGDFSGWFDENVSAPLSDAMYKINWWLYLYVIKPIKNVAEWFTSNVWDPIAKGADKAISFIVGLYDIGEHAVKMVWGVMSTWFDNNVWQPLVMLSSVAWGLITDKVSSAWTGIQILWALVPEWFNTNVWQPLTLLAGAAWFFVTDAVSLAWTTIKVLWGTAAGWFTDNVWTPLVTFAEFAMSWVSDKFELAWTAITAIWSLVPEWFEETIWMPLTVGVELLGLWIGEKFEMAWTAITAVWSLAVGWFDETIWVPLTTAAGVIGSAISGAFSLAWTSVTVAWGVATGWFQDTIWTPLTVAAETLGTWIGDKFTDGWNVITDIWGAAGVYFDDNIWTPIKVGAGLVEDAIKAPFKAAWEYVSGIFTKLGDTWDTIKEWGGKAVEWGSDAVGYVTQRGEERRGIESDPEYARGTNFHPGGPAIVGDGGGPELIRYPNGFMSLSPGTATRMNLPRGTQVLPHRETMKFLDQVPAYKDGIGFNNGSFSTEKVSLPKEQVSAAVSSGGSKVRSVTGGVRDVIVQITGESHYHDEMDAEKVGKVAVAAVKKELEDDYNEGGEMVVYG